MRSWCKGQLPYQLLVFICARKNCLDVQLIPVYAVHVTRVFIWPNQLLVIISARKNCLDVQLIPVNLVHFD